MKRPPIIGLSLLPLLAALMFLLALPAEGRADEFKITRQDDGLTIIRNGELLTRYVQKSGAKPIFWPVIGAGGHEITRAYPMREGDETERKDHPHHRSFWFTHGDVNGVDFWMENTGHGDINHREYVKVEDGEAAVVATRNDWIGPDGKKICEDERWFTFGGDGERWWVDCVLIVTASDGPVVFGDTKEGSFGVRVAGTMKVESEPGGEVVNSEGQKDKDAWGKPAAWVDYHGPLKGETEGIAILNHPQSARYPTHWHVRTYGLFCANPFGLGDFLGKDNDGSLKLEKGESFTLRYRVLFHKGDEKAGRVAESFAEYEKTK